MTVRQAFVSGKERLKNLEDGTFDAALLLQKATGLDRLGIIMEEMRCLTHEEAEAYETLLAKRLSGYPTQYLLGEWEFMGLPFLVDERVLIPRPDTELLVEEALSRRPRFVADIGTGSGCIAISLAYYGKAQVFAVDISQDALDVAKDNAEKNGVSIAFYHGDLFAPLPKTLRGCLDMVVSNPPYIEDKVMDTLMCEVRDHEPHLALNGGKRGMEVYHRLVPEAMRWLRPGGWLLLEIGYDQGALVRRLMTEVGFAGVQVLQAPDGLDRVAIGKKE